MSPSLLGLWLAAPSFAQEELCRPLELAALVEGLDSSELAFEQGNSGRGTAIVDEYKGKMRCLTELPTPAIMARLASLEALAGHFDQDPDRSVRWARAAEWVVPGHIWPGAVAADHPLRTLLVAEGPATIGEKGRFQFEIPDNGALVVSGRLLVDTDLATDVPLFLQVCNGEGQVVRAEWLEGGAFPEDLTGNDAPTVPTWWSREAPSGVPRFVPAAPTTRALRAAVWGAGGGGFVGQSLDEPGAFLAAQDAAGGVGSLGATLRAPLGPVGVFADLRGSLPGAVGLSEGFAGLSLAAGPVTFLAGGGGATSPVFEADERRRLLVWQPRLGAEVTVPVGSLALDAGVAGSWLPWASHARLGVDLHSVGGLGWTAGLEGGLVSTRFVQPTSDRTLQVTGLWAGVRAGLSFGG